MTTITTEGGTIIRLDTIDGDTVVILDHPLAPTDMRNIEAGRVLDGGFQPASFAAFGLSPATLRGIADVLEQASS